MATQQKIDLKGKKILVTEDDAHLRSVVCKILDSLGCETRFAENGLVAKTILDLNKEHFDLVLSDVRMPEMDGIALLVYCKQHFPKTKFIIFTGFSEILEAQEAARIGADAFLAKPFRLSELVKQIEQCFVEKPKNAELTEEEKFDTERSFCKIRVEDFMSTTRLPSDIYVRVAPSKFVKVAKEGTDIEVQRIRTYKDRKVEYFYVKTEDFGKYTGLNLKLAKAVTNSSRLTPAQKIRLYKHTGEVLLQQIFVGGLDPVVCEETGDIVNNTLNALNENEDLFELLMIMQTQGDRLYTHSLAVSVYACMIARKMGWVSAPNQYKLMLAGIFHDIGLKEIPEALHEKPRFKMTSDEVKLYESHVARGRDLLLSMPDFPDELTAIVFQHHETMTGTGYPMQLPGSKIHPLARVLRLADELAEKMMTAANPSIGTAGEILIHLQQTKADEFDPDVMAGAFDLMGIERLPGMRRKVAS